MFESAPSSAEVEQLATDFVVHIHEWIDERFRELVEVSTLFETNHRFVALGNCIINVLLEA